MELKDILIGAAVQIVAKSASHIGFIMLEKQGIDPNANPWYSEPLGPGFPATDDMVLDLGLPAGLLMAGKVSKKKSLTGMGVGAAISGAAVFIHDLIRRQGGIYINPTAAYLESHSPVTSKYIIN